MEPIICVPRTYTFETMRWLIDTNGNLNTKLREAGERIVTWVESHGGTARYSRDGYGYVYVDGAGRVDHETPVVVWDGHYEKFLVMTEEEFVSQFETMSPVTDGEVPAVPAVDSPVFPRDAETIIEWADGNWDVNIEDLHREMVLWAGYFENIVILSE